MPRRTFAERGLVPVVIAALLAAGMQPPLTVISLLIGAIIVIVAAGTVAWHGVIALARRSYGIQRALRPLPFVIAVVVGLVTGGIVFRMRLAAAERDAERFVRPLTEARQMTGRYPATLDRLPDAPPLPAFAAPGFYSASERRDEFTLTLAYETWAFGRWTSWMIYDSRTGRWTSRD